MEQLPKIAQRRLPENPKPGVHPDPDLLAAFAEKSLNDRERVQVLQHLGVCADCRDVVSLAMPPSESTGTQAADRSSWLTWPMLRWGALAACIVVVSAAVTLRYQRRQAGESSVAGKATASLSTENNLPQPPLAKLATKIPPPAPFQPDRDLGLEGKPAKQDNAATVAAQTGVPAPPQLEQKKRTDDHLANAFAMTSADKSASAAVVIAAAAPHAPPAPSPAQTRQRSEARNNSVEPVPGAMTETVIVESAAPALQTSQSSEQKAKDESIRNESQEETRAAAAGVSARATGDQKSDALSSAMSQVVVGGYAKRSHSSYIVPRWTLSAAGVLQRSSDSGKTWQTVPVANNVVFRALAANDSDIWVGGAAGALYHSSDAGQHWVQVNPVVDGQPLTADIVTVDFSDRLHGKLTTSNHEIWSTSDAGNTWQRH
ncbi:MAG: YCF48-related protein [Terriglobales bacterium]